LEYCNVVTVLSFMCMYLFYAIGWKMLSGVWCVVCGVVNLTASWYWLEISSLHHISVISQNPLTNGIK